MNLTDSLQRVVERHKRITISPVSLMGHAVPARQRICRDNVEQGGESCQRDSPSQKEKK